MNVGAGKIPSRGEVDEGGATLRLTNWQRCLPPERSGVSAVLSPFNAKRFERRNVFDIAREDDVAGVIASVVWGYPKGTVPGGRWQPFRELFAKAEDLAAYLKPYRSMPIEADALLAGLPHTFGIGLSTLSKVFYFLSVRTIQGPALIYDQFVMNGVHQLPVSETAELRRKIPTGYAYHRQMKTYGCYLSSISDWARRVGVEPDRLEAMLFGAAPRRGKSPFLDRPPTDAE